MFDRRVQDRKSALKHAVDTNSHCVLHFQQRYNIIWDSVMDYTITFHPWRLCQWKLILALINWLSYWNCNRNTTTTSSFTTCISVLVEMPDRRLLFQVKVFQHLFDFIEISAVPTAIPRFVAKKALWRCRLECGLGRSSHRPISASLSSPPRSLCLTHPRLWLVNSSNAKSRFCQRSRRGVHWTLRFLQSDRCLPCMLAVCSGLRGCLESKFMQNPSAGYHR